MTAEDLFESALLLAWGQDPPVDVKAVDVPLARQAIDLHLSMGGDLKTLLHHYGWDYSPRVPLSLAFDGADLERECRLHACWCARSMLHLIPDRYRDILRECLRDAERHAVGQVPRAVLRHADSRAAEILKFASPSNGAARCGIDVVAAAVSQRPEWATRRTSSFAAHLRSYTEDDPLIASAEKQTDRLLGLVVQSLS